MIIKSKNGNKQVMYCGCEVRVENGLAQVFVLGYDGKMISVYGSEDIKEARALAAHLFSAYADGVSKIDVGTWMDKYQEKEAAGTH